MKLGLMVGCLLIASVAHAQTPVVGTEQLQWDQGAVSLAQAQSYSYDVQDGTAAPVAVSPVTCSGAASPFVCSTRLPALTTGLHALAVRARVVVNGTTLQSTFSAPLSILMMAIPAIPQNVRIG